HSAVPRRDITSFPTRRSSDLRLNNMEQVLINNPASGNYQIEIEGFNVPVGPQSYYVVYEIITDQLVLTYPNGNEKFVPNQQEAIHWDATNTATSFTLEYSTNNGGSWSNIATVNNAYVHFWTVPNSVSGDVKVRVTAGGLQDESDSTFSIAPQVSNVQVIQVCEDTATFSWNSVTDA